MITSRPLFKGVFHTIAAILYIFALPYLRAQIPIDLNYPLNIYLFTVIGHFMVSSIFHLIPWTPRMTALHLQVRRLDHVVIFMTIAATYYAAIATVMSDINHIVIYFLGLGTTLGIIIRIFFTNAPQVLIMLPYLLMGWSLILDPNLIISLFKRLPMGTFIGSLGGILCTIGAGIYTFQRPNPCPRYLGFHELFHIFATIGIMLLTVAIFRYSIPYYVQNIGTK